MKLEDEISQKKFRSETHKLSVNLIYTYNWLISHQSTFLKKNGLTGQQFNILRILRGMNGKSASIKLLRERMLDKMSDASRIVEKLRVKGLIQRTTNTDDRRTCDVFITQKGLDLLAKIDEQNSVMDNFLSNLNDDQKKQLNDLLDDLRG